MAKPAQPQQANPHAESLLHYLTGYGRGRPAELQRLASVSDWQARARAELDRRANAMIETLDNDVLAAIAAGDVDVARLAEQAAAGG